jgi:hypothetical protein
MKRKQFEDVGSSNRGAPMGRWEDTTTPPVGTLRLFRVNFFKDYMGF